MRRLKPPNAKSGAFLHAPSTEGAGATNKQHPVFCVRDLANLHSCEHEELAAFTKTLHKLAQQSWQDLYQRGKHKGGYETISVGQLKGVNLTMIPAGCESVLSFRFDGMKPMLGLRQGATLRILHLDRDFTAYDHG